MNSLKREKEEHTQKKKKFLQGADQIYRNQKGNWTGSMARVAYSKITGIESQDLLYDHRQPLGNLIQW